MKKNKSEVKKRTEREGNTLKGKNEKERGAINGPKRKGGKKETLGKGKLKGNML